MSSSRSIREEIATPPSAIKMRRAQNQRADAPRAINRLAKNRISFSLHGSCDRVSENRSEDRHDDGEHDAADQPFADVFNSFAPGHLRRREFENFEPANIQWPRTNPTPIINGATGGMEILLASSAMTLFNRSQCATVAATSICTPQIGTMPKNNPSPTASDSAKDHARGSERNS